MLIRILTDQDFGRTDGAALCATFGQRFALPQGRLRRPRQGVVDGIEMSGVAADVAAVAFFAADTTDVLTANATDVLSAAKAASGGSCPAISPTFNSKANGQ